MASAKKSRTRSPIFLRSEESTNTVEHRVSRASSKATAQTLDAVRTTGVYLAPAMLKRTSRTELSAAGSAPAGLEGLLGAFRKHHQRLMPARHPKRSDGRRSWELPMQPGSSPLEVGARSFSGFSQREGDEQASRPRLECEALPFPRERSGGPDSGRPNGRSQLSRR